MSNKREMVTFKAKVFDYLNPNSGSICIEDIAHHLALVNRYNGSTKMPYSVAEHSVRMSYMTVGEPLLNLLHDAAEAYIGDVIGPQKKGLKWSSPSGGFDVEYKQVEMEILRQIGKALDIPDLKSWLSMPEHIKKADVIMYVTEIRDLLPPQAMDLLREQGWMPDDVEPLPQMIIPWPWHMAENEFLSRYRELSGGNLTNEHIHH